MTTDNVPPRFSVTQHEEDVGERCGICGDPYDEPQPRTHEIGGPYYKGYLVQNYTAGTVSTNRRALTKFHEFEFTTSDNILPTYYTI